MEPHPVVLSGGGQTGTSPRQQSPAHVGRAERGSNTEQHWEVHVAAISESNRFLSAQYKSLLSQRTQEEERHKQHIQQLQKKKIGGFTKHQAQLETLESLRVKLKLNDGSAYRKSISSKKREMTSLKNRAEEENRRLTKELGEGEERLRALLEEQEQEKGVLEQELVQLMADTERARAAARSAQLLALKEEIVAVEKQRDVARFCFDTWLREVGLYLQALKTDPSQQNLQERLKWEKQECVVQKSQEHIQHHFQELLQKLHHGHPLDSLPQVEVPPLPKVPTVDLIISQILLSLNHATFLPPPPPCSPFKPPYRAPLRATPPPHHAPSSPVAPPRTPPPGSPAQPRVSDPAGKLDKLLEKLGAKFPQCTRAQLMSVLQQIKSSRGTMAGLSVEMVTEQVGLKLAQSQRRSPGPISRPTPVAPRTFPGAHSVAPRPAVVESPVFLARRFCLMCQDPVDPGSQQPLHCSHSIHRECISVWLQSSGNNTCPFCPAK